MVIIIIIIIAIVVKGTYLSKVKVKQKIDFFPIRMV